MASIRKRNGKLRVRINREDISVTKQKLILETNHIIHISSG